MKIVKTPHNIGVLGEQLKFYKKKLPQRNSQTDNAYAVAKKTLKDFYDGGNHLIYTKTGF